MKVLTIAIALIMILGLCCGSCALAEEPVDVNWFWSEGANCVVPEDAFIVRRILEDLNIRYVHISPQGADFEEKLSLMLTNPESMPDIIESYSALTRNMVSWGVAVDISEYMTEEYVPNLIRIQKNWDLAVDYLTDNEGCMYALPNTNLNLVNETCYIRYDWLENLGLDVPTTMDELFDVLHAFRYGDPDGNGQDDTWGTVSNEYWGLSGFALNFAAARNSWYMGDDGLVELGAYRDESIAYLKFIKSLYDDGSLHPEIATLSFNDCTDLVKLGKIGFLWSWNGHENEAEIQKVQPGAIFRPMNPVKGIFDKGYNPCGGIMRQQYVITVGADIEACMKLINYMCDDRSTEEAMDFTGTYWEQKYGEYGVNWYVDEDGSVETGGKDPVIKANNEGLFEWAGQWRRFVSKFDKAWLINADEDFLSEYRADQASPKIMDIPSDDPNAPINTESVILPAAVSAFSAEFTDVFWPEFFFKAIFGKVDIEVGFTELVESANESGYQEIRWLMTEVFRDAGMIP